MNDLETLRKLVLAPYILKATALIGVSRKVGGNQFRHSFATLGILMDYKYFNDAILLKAALLHDLLEDLPATQVDEIRGIDLDGHKVVDLVLEVTKRNDETKPEYLERVLRNGSKNAKILKCADRISNLTDLHLDTHTNKKISEYLDQTEKFVLPMAAEVNKNMVMELTDLVAKRRTLCKLGFAEKVIKLF
jgi:(p)ppGpp synthase/HD superfamily hydrolase